MSKKAELKSAVARWWLRFAVAPRCGRWRTGLALVCSLSSDGFTELRACAWTVWISATGQMGLGVGPTVFPEKWRTWC